MNLQSEFFEKYGDYMLRQGYPALAIRTWNLCAQSGPMPDRVAEKIRQQEQFLQAAAVPPKRCGEHAEQG